MVIPEDLGVGVGDIIRIRKNGLVIQGVVMPKHAYSAPDILVVKLESGYNIGVSIDSNTSIEIIGKKPIEQVGVEQSRSVVGVGPMVKVIGTGGTIASKVEYETGAVRPAMTSEELLEIIPEAGEIARLDVEILMSILSENMEPEYWERIAESVYRAMISGYEGVVITHGTDTMSFTSAAIAFAIQNMPVPAVFVGSQRSSDRPSTDAATNFIGALLAAAKAPFAESVVAMHSDTSDLEIAIHRGTRVRKMHTSRRDAFQSINAQPIAMIDPYKREIRVVGSDYRPRGRGEPILYNGFEKKVALIYSYPGIEAELIDIMVDKGYRGIVIAGTGFGHVPEKLVPSLKRAIENGIPVAITSQTLYGRVNLAVYSTGREMLRAGVIPCEDMLPEVAYVKLSWILRRARDMGEIRKLMLTNMAGEISLRHTKSLYR
ncbi:MAG TPA: Glu-tRNA(Gln) amidotransferase subunit GatD [Sulfolobales archaeon]|nr:Glu-tRNA(Gln) amidotransferase subunit GatD [Sulfolobales archaeon]